MQARTHTISPQIPRPSDSGWIIPPAFLAIHFADRVFWDVSACLTPHKPIPITGDRYILLVLFLWKTQTQKNTKLVIRPDCAWHKHSINMNYKYYYQYQYLPSNPYVSISSKEVLCDFLSCVQLISQTPAPNSPPWSISVQRCERSVETHLTSLLVNTGWPFFPLPCCHKPTPLIV